LIAVTVEAAQARAKFFKGTCDGRVVEFPNVTMWAAVRRAVAVALATWMETATWTWSPRAASSESIPIFAEEASNWSRYSKGMVCETCKIRKVCRNEKTLSVWLSLADLNGDGSSTLNHGKARTPIKGQQSSELTANWLGALGRYGGYVG